MTDHSASTDDECIHGLGPVAACVICNGRARSEDAAERARPITFPAAYEGQCPECNLPIYVGNIIAWREGYRAVHADCWKEPDDA